MEFHYNIHKTRDVKFPRLLPNKYKMLLYASEDVVIEPGKYEILNMGLKANLPRNTFLTITPKLGCNVDADGFEWNDSQSVFSITVAVPVSSGAMTASVSEKGSRFDQKSRCFQRRFL